MSRTVVVAAVLSAAFSVAPGALAATAGDDDRRSGSHSERGESYSERYSERESWSERESYSDRDDHHHHDHHGRSHDRTQWHFADPERGDFDFHHGPRRGDDRGDRGHRHHERGARAGDGGDGGQ